MLITLTTDFGTSDGYVAAMKGVILSLAPQAQLVDVTHDVAPQDVRGAALMLWSTLPHFAPPCIHITVVDPEVGSARRALASATSLGVLVGPDNGVFSRVWDEAPAFQTVELRNPAYMRGLVSSTFHGRDVFAPVAAHLALGVPLPELGPQLRDPYRLPAPALHIADDRLIGEVLHIDHFGNAITGIGRLVWRFGELHLTPAFLPQALPAGVYPASRLRVRVAGREIGPVRESYASVGAGVPLALVGSSGLLEVAVNRGSASQALGLSVGDGVEVLLI